MVGHLFSSIEEASNELEFTVKASYVEIYQEKIRDLLDGFIIIIFFIY